MNASEEWEVFRRFTDVGSAQVMCTWLLRERVPAKVETRSLENAREGEYCVLVHRKLAHRARWVVAQLPASEEELEYLATGQLPGAKGEN
jgi:hypothetical protein